MAGWFPLAIIARIGGEQAEQGINVEFRGGVPEPLVIGDGRFLGLGMMAPLRGETSRGRSQTRQDFGDLGAPLCRRSEWR